MHESDLCSFFFLADRYWHNAFLKDIRTRGGSANTTGQGGGGRDWGVQPATRTFQAQGNFGKMEGANFGKMEGAHIGKMEGVGGWDRGGPGAPLRSGAGFREAVKRQGFKTPPPAGTAMKTCVKEMLPALASLLAVIER